jgi:SAM-dependent methyltransferase
MNSLGQKLKSGINELLLNRVGVRWGRLNRVRSETRSAKSRWWQFKQITKHIDDNIYSHDDKTGYIAAAVHEFKILPCEMAISVGCGNAVKELALLKEGLVQHFDLYDVSAERVEEVKRRAESLGLNDRISVFCCNVFDEPLAEGMYDLVFWNNSLHHMFNVSDAMRWTHSVLKKGGGLLLNDFVGPSRFQWTDEQLDYAARIRNCFRNTRFLDDPAAAGQQLPIEVTKPSKLAMIYDDPSEAADSSNIVFELKKHFPSATIWKTGGVVYHLALNEMLANFDEHEDSHLIELLMFIDDLLVDRGETHYAVAFAKK